MEHTEASAIAELAVKGMESEVLERDGVTMVVMPRDRELRSIKSILDEHLKQPERRKGTAEAQELESLVEMVNRSKDTHSALFADRDGPRLMGVINYNASGAEVSTSARWGDHRVVYNFPVSDAWQAWMATSGTWISQADFAAFLEDHVTDVLDPSKASDVHRQLIEQVGGAFATPARLMELARGLTVNVNRKVSNQQNLASGEAQLMFTEEHNDAKGKQLKVPSAFLLALPVFRNGDLFKVVARLRYRVREGTVTWSYALHQTEQVFDVAFREACTKAQKGTKCPLYYGRPER